MMLSFAFPCCRRSGHCAVAYPRPGEGRTACRWSETTAAATGPFVNAATTTPGQERWRKIAKVPSTYIRSTGRQPGHGFLLYHSENEPFCIPCLVFPCPQHFLSFPPI